MASPPHSALSPSYSGTLSLPKKRPATSSSGPNTVKRRKPSTSSLSHPLRQTSFPPPEALATSSRATSFSPPVSESNRGGAARSIAGSSSITKHSRRGRNKAADTQSNAGKSVAGARAVSFHADEAASVSTRRGRTGRNDVDLDRDKENDEEFLNQDAVMEEGKENEVKMAAEHVSMLVNVFNDDQMERYNTWRRVRLNKGTLKRIANQTLSQSISDACSTVLNACTKAFIGELIERARDVQTEWLAASPTLPTGEAKIDAKTHAPTLPSANDPAVHDTIQQQENPPEATVAQNDDATNDAINKDLTTSKSFFVVQERDRGPLTPDHLREALRRYKKDRDGGSAGVQGVSIHGKIAAAARAGGRRLFQ